MVVPIEVPHALFNELLSPAGHIAAGAALRGTEWEATLRNADMPATGRIALAPAMAESPKSANQKAPLSVFDAASAFDDDILALDADLAMTPGHGIATTDAAAAVPGGGGLQSAKGAADTKHTDGLISAEGRARLAALPDNAIIFVTLHADTAANTGGPDVGAFSLPVPCLWRRPAAPSAVGASAAAHNGGLFCLLHSKDRARLAGLLAAARAKRALAARASAQDSTAAARGAEQVAMDPVHAEARRVASYQNNKFKN
jgi:hypothetical protein